MTGRDDRPWRVTDALWVFGAGLVGSTAALAAVGPELTGMETYAVVVPAQTLAMVGAVAWMASRSARRRLSLGLRYGEGDAMGIVWGLLVQVAVTLALLPIVHFVFDGEAPTQEVVEAASGLEGIGAALVVLGAVVLAPLAEELLFRGVLLRALLRNRGPAFAVYVSAGAFAAIHLLDPNAWLAVPMLFVLGVVLGKQAVSTGRLGMPLLTHMAFNGLSVAALLLAG